LKSTPGSANNPGNRFAVIGCEQKGAGVEKGRDSDKAASAAPSDAHGTRKTLGWFLACFLAPSLLCVPILGMLRYDAYQRDDANAILRKRIAQLDAQIVDVKDLNKVHAQWMMRRQIVEQVQIDATKPFALLSILNHIPAGVQLLFLESRVDRLALVARHATADGDLAIIEQLAKSGFGDLHIADRQPATADAAASLRIEAAVARERSP
jgi:Tfp pilus assembly protein PilN